MTRKRWPMMIGGLLIAGAAAGAVGALMSRRRQQKWQEYGSGRQTDSLRRDAGTMLDTGTQKIASMTDTAKEKASDVLGQVRSTTPPMGDKTAIRFDLPFARGSTDFSGSSSTLPIADLPPGRRKRPGSCLPRRYGATPDDAMMQQRPGGTR